MPPYLAAVQILDGTNDITSLIDWSTLDLSIVLTKEKGTLKFDILTPKAPTLPTNMPALGDAIYLNYTIVSNIGTTTKKLFGGTVTVLETKNEGGMLLRASITCQDWGYKFDAKMVKTQYTAMDPADIVADIVANFCPAGFNATTYVQRGNFLVPTIKFNYKQPTKAIESLASLIGWDWYIDPDKNLHFFFAGNYTGTSEDFPAPFDITDTSGDTEYESLDLSIDLSNMKNSVYVIGGTYDASFNGADSFVVNSSTTTYPLQYGYDTSVTFTVHDVTASADLVVGISGVDDPSTVDCLYNATTQSIVFANPAAFSGHTIHIIGDAVVPVAAHLTDNASIALYGEIQDVIIDSTVTSVAEAQERAYSEIIQFGHPVFDVKFTTISQYANLLYIGQKIMLNSASYGVASKPLIIKRIDAKMRTPNIMEFSVECLGSDKVTFTDMMLYLLQQNQALSSPPDSTILQIILTEVENIAVSDTITVTGGSIPHQWGPRTPQIRWGFFTWK